MLDLTEVDVRAALRAAATAELCWVAGGHPHSSPVVPLQVDGRPALAVPYVRAQWARDVAAQQEVVLTLSDPRLSGQRWKAVSLRARPRLVEDRGGDLFTDEMLEDELRKYPPSRALVDSILLRRENWWYVPRLVLYLDVTETTLFVERFAPTTEMVLVTVDDGRPRVDAVRVTSSVASAMALEALGTRDLPTDADEALLLAHDFTEPDMELWQTFEVRGPLVASSLRAETPSFAGVQGRMPRLTERLRRQRDLRRGCLAGLRTG